MIDLRWTGVYKSAFQQSFTLKPFLHLHQLDEICEKEDFELIESNLANYCLHWIVNQLHLKHQTPPRLHTWGISSSYVIQFGEAARAHYTRRITLLLCTQDSVAPRLNNWCPDVDTCRRHTYSWLFNQWPVLYARFHLYFRAGAIKSILWTFHEYSDLVMRSQRIRPHVA